MKTIFTNGCFDIVHRSHIELLRFCKARGRVIVGLNSDKSVKSLKGPSRPIFNQVDRKFLLESLSCVDEVHIFDEDTPYNLIERLMPDEIVKGGDYAVEEIAGHDLCEVVLYPYDPNNSSTKALDKLTSSFIMK